MYDADCIMVWKKFLKEWFYFSRKERLGIYILSILVVLLWVLPSFFSYEEQPLEALNISAVQLDSFEHILIKRKSNFNGYKQYVYKKGTPYEHQNRLKKPFAINLPIIDVNKADSADFEKLPGIGEKLSTRIVKYRERIGGYIMVEQLKEIYGLQDSNFLKFKHLLIIQKEFIPNKIFINKSAYSDLRKHPYIGHVFAKSVLAYIKMHGSIKDENELLSIGSIKNDEVLKVLPYLDFSQ